MAAVLTPRKTESCVVLYPKEGMLETEILRALFLRKKRRSDDFSRAVI
ncbi:MAG: hypothetical protein ACREEM_17260 [Blastocatellia bacterium]